MFHPKLTDFTSVCLQISQKSGTLPWELEDSGGGRSAVPHASSLDAISGKQRTPEAVPTPKVPNRSATCSVCEYSLCTEYYDSNKHTTTYIYK